MSEERVIKGSFILETDSTGSRNGIEVTGVWEVRPICLTMNTGFLGFMGTWFKITTDTDKVLYSNNVYSVSSMATAPKGRKVIKGRIEECFKEPLLSMPRGGYCPNILTIGRLVAEYCPDNGLYSVSEVSDKGQIGPTLHSTALIGDLYNFSTAYQTEVCKSRPQHVEEYKELPPYAVYLSKPKEKWAIKVVRGSSKLDEGKGEKVFNLMSAYRGSWKTFAKSITVLSRNFAGGKSGVVCEIHMEYKGYIFFTCAGEWYSATLADILMNKKGNIHTGVDLPDLLSKIV